MNAALRFAIWAVLFLAVLLASLFLFWSFWPYKLQTHPPRPAKVEWSHYQAGDQFVYYVEYCKFSASHATVYRTLVDGVRLSFPPIQSNLPLGCGTFKSITLKLPDFVPPGEYYVEINTEYKPNPIRTINIPYQTEHFWVDPKPDLRIEQMQREISNNFDEIMQMKKRR